MTDFALDSVILTSGILLLDFIVHLDEVLLTLLLLVLFHELLDHLFSILLAFLADVLLNELVHAADLLLLRRIRLCLGCKAAAALIVAPCERSFCAASDETLVAFALTAFALL